MTAPACSTPVGPLFSYRWACRFCLSMATRTSPQLSSATPMVSLTLLAPMMDASSLQQGETTAPL